MQVRNFQSLISEQRFHRSEQYRMKVTLGTYVKISPCVLEQNKSRPSITKRCNCYTIPLPDLSASKPRPRNHQRPCSPPHRSRARSPPHPAPPITHCNNPMPRTWNISVSLDLSRRCSKKGITVFRANPARPPFPANSGARNPSVARSRGIQTRTGFGRKPLRASS